MELGKIDRGDTHMPSVPTYSQGVWHKVASTLRTELGDGPYNSYVAPSALRQGLLGQGVIVTSTQYARDWIIKNVLKRANELWANLSSDGSGLEVMSRSEYEDLSKTLAQSNAAQSNAYLAPNSAQPQTPTSGATSPVLNFSEAASRIVGLQERLTFESFVPGRGNEFAYTMSRQVASWADGHFNPVFFHGPYGYGKTHLLNAIAWEAQARRPEAKIVYLTAEKFTSAFVKSIHDRSIAAFKEGLRTADLLLIDDVHFIGGKTQSQEELFHTLTALLENNRRVVFTSDRPPSHLSEIEARLRSHLSSGLVCALDVADQSLRLGIVERKLLGLIQRLGHSQMPNSDILQFLADRVPGSIRELEGAVNTLAASAGSRLGSLTLDEAMALLQPNLKVAVERRVTVDEIQKLTADHFALKQSDLLSERRTRSVARPRQVAMWLCKQHTTRSYPDIGRRFGGRDHTTVLHAVKKIEELMQIDDQIARDVEALTRKLRSS
jgi:chromosomal replication initiator protein